MANTFERFGRAVMAGIKAFREQDTLSSLVDSDEWGDFDTRKVRYEVAWNFYQSSIYSEALKLAAAYKTAYSMYKFTRNIYNPTYRLVEFWKSMVFGGPLDMQAGKYDAIPILIPDTAGAAGDSLRLALAQLYEDSNWGSKKDLFVQNGALLGDSAIAIRDDISKGRVWMEIIPPSSLRSVTMDERGYVRSYTIEEPRYDEGARKECFYSEMAERDGLNVVYSLYKDGKPYHWQHTNATGALEDEWAEPYTFTPMVYVQHNDVGLEWGWSEAQAQMSKIREIDDMASLLHDQLRKTVNAIWFASGVSKPKNEISFSGNDKTTNNLQPGREEDKMIYGPVGSDVKPMVAPLQIAEALETIGSIVQELERELPELQMDIWSAESGSSGRALRIARQRVEKKVRTRRGQYDSGMVRAQQMAIAIGGMRNYQGYEGFDLSSYDKGALDHSIDPKRPVFDVDPADDAETKRTFWEGAKAAVDAGLPLEAYLRDSGWDDKRIQEIYLGLPEQ